MDFQQAPKNTKYILKHSTRVQTQPSVTAWQDHRRPQRTDTSIFVFSVRQRCECTAPSSIPSLSECLLKCAREHTATRCVDSALSPHDSLSRSFLTLCCNGSTRGTGEPFYESVIPPSKQWPHSGSKLMKTEMHLELKTLKTSILSDGVLLKVQAKKLGYLISSLSARRS